MLYYNSSIVQKVPKLAEYFQKGITDENKNISHCLLFWGSDITAQCELALEVARLLNCKEDKSQNCDCLNCRWIREQTHPAVKIYTRLDFKEADKTSGDDDESSKGKKNITAVQARAIINELLVTSNYHRVYIFCDRDEDGNLLPLNRINFPEATSNTLLKTFEEPPQNTTFIFLTKDKTDIISTVVSRAQAFFVPTVQETDNDFSLVEDVFSNYWTLDRNQVPDLETKLLGLITEHSAKEIFTQMQNYMAEVLKNNSENKVLFYRLTEDLKYTDEALQQVSLSRAMNIQTVVENLCFKLILK